MNKYQLWIVLLGFALFCNDYARADETYTFSIVPQQSARKTVKIWKPIIKRLEKETGARFIIRTAKDISTFEQRLGNNIADFSYMNPYHYTVFHEKSGYYAILKAKNKLIKGIVVVRKDSPIQSIEELAGETLAFPSLAAFAASILPRADMKQGGVSIKPDYVGSHDYVYRLVANNLRIAGGGVMRTFENTDPGVHERLRVLWMSKGYTPHAIAAHPRVKSEVVAKVKDVFIKLDSDAEGKEILKSMKLEGFEAAKNSDWDDIRSLKIDEL